MTLARCPVRDTIGTPHRRAFLPGSSRYPLWRPTAGRRARRNNMSYNADPAIPAAVVLAVAAAVAVALFVAALLLGLCRAAADTRDVEPDAGEYE